MKHYNIVGEIKVEKLTDELKKKFKTFLITHWRDHAPWLKSNMMVYDFLKEEGIKYSKYHNKMLMGYTAYFLAKLNKRGKIERYGKRMWRIK